MKVQPDVRASTVEVTTLEQHLRSSHLPSRVVNACIWALHWDQVKALPEAARFGLPDPFEPLIAMFELGGRFTTEHGWVDVGGAAFRLGRGADHLDGSPTRRSAVMNPLAARARTLSCLDPDTGYVLELIARAAEVGWIRPPDLPELLDSLRDGHDWRSEEIGFEPRDDQALVSFLDETVSCPAAALLNMLAQLIAAQEHPTGELLLGHVERRRNLSMRMRHKVVGNLGSARGRRGDRTRISSDDRYPKLAFARRRELCSRRSVKVWGLYGGTAPAH